MLLKNIAGDLNKYIESTEDHKSRLLALEALKKIEELRLLNTPKVKK